MQENALGIEGGRDGARHRRHREGTEAGAYPRCPRHPPGLGGTNRARGGEAAAHTLPTPSRDTLPLFPQISLFYLCFFKVFPSPHPYPGTAQTLSRAPQSPTRGCFARGCSCSPIHPHLGILDKTSPSSTATPLRTQAAATRLLWMFFPQEFSLAEDGKEPQSWQCWEGTAPAVTYLGWVPGRRFWGPGRAARPGGAHSGFGVPSC